MNIQEIYGLLFAGKKIEMDFLTLQDIATFKIRLHQVKLANEKPMMDVGMIEEKDRQQLNFQYADTDIGPFSVKIFLSDKVPKKQYEVKILEDED